MNIEIAKWLQKPPKGCLINCYMVKKVNERFKFPKQNQPFKFGTSVRKKQSVKDIVSEKSFIGLETGWYVLQPHLKHLEGKKRGMNLFGDVVCWVRIDVQVNGTQRIRYITYKNLQEYPKLND